jgi:hypothetical protein
MPVEPTDREEEFFARQEYERKRKLEEERHRKMEESERKRLRELHHMRCPKCGLELIPIDYKGVEVDKCSACAGVWLDAGELEQLTHMKKVVLDKFLGVFTK